MLLPVLLQPITNPERVGRFGRLVRLELQCSKYAPSERRFMAPATASAGFELQES